jgi:hypothetical protein
MLQLRINQEFGCIGINQTAAQMRVHSRLADLDIKQELGQFEINAQPPQVKMDLKGAFGDLGMRKPDQVAEELKAQAWQRFGEGLGRVVAEGDRLGRIELGGHPIVEIARENFAEHKELNVQALPKQPPRISSLGGELSLRYHLGGAEISVSPNFPQIKYSPGSIEIYLLQEPWIEIEVVGSNVDMLV